jgi:hypothetical protein
MNLTRARHGAGLELAVADGRVGCPREGDTDVEHCLACGYLDEIDDEERPQLVTCRYREEDYAAALDVFDKRYWDRP